MYCIVLFIGRHCVRQGRHFYSLMFTPARADEIHFVRSTRSLVSRMSSGFVELIYIIRGEDVAFVSELSRQDGHRDIEHRVSE